jgi:hypothetical protein
LHDGGLDLALFQHMTYISFPTIIRHVLTDAVQSYFSMYRQYVEHQALGRGDDRQAEYSAGEVEGEALRFGGGGRNWANAIAFLAILPLAVLIWMILVASFSAWADWPQNRREWVFQAEEGIPGVFRPEEVDDDITLDERDVALLGGQIPWRDKQEEAACVSLELKEE